MVLRKFVVNILIEGSKWTKLGLKLEASQIIINLSGVYSSCKLITPPPNSPNFLTR